MNKEFERMVTQAIEGQQEAVAELLHRLKPLVLSYSKRYGGTRGVDEDAYQEGILEILKALQDFDPSRKIPFLGYITTKLRHYYQNRRRKEKYHYSLNQRINGEDNTATLEDLLEDEKVNIEEESIRKEEKQQLMAAIKNLSPRQQETINAYYFKRQTLKEIGGDRSIHPISVAKTKATALKNLEKSLKNLK
ncbi:MAG: sigma-70 family RNA polymerase sigma factor [Clostridiaceae bacterium]|nr:sigma-70 family RNA polymerase sigma factor [Clostridiaceae bacterium]